LFIAVIKKFDPCLETTGQLVNFVDQLITVVLCGGYETYEYTRWFDLFNPVTLSNWYDTFVYNKGLETCHAAALTMLKSAKLYALYTLLGSSALAMIYKITKIIATIAVPIISLAAPSMGPVCAAIMATTTTVPELVVPTATTTTSENIPMPIPGTPTIANAAPLTASNIASVTTPVTPIVANNTTAMHANTYVTTDVFSLAAITSVAIAITSATVYAIVKTISDKKKKGNFTPQEKDKIKKLARLGKYAF
jgi:hypothetical protein